MSRSKRKSRLEYIKAILFDLDGVLVDSFDSWWTAHNEALEKFGKGQISKEEFRKKCWGHDIKFTFEKLGLGDGVAEYCEARHKNHIKETKIFSGTRKTLESLGRKFKLGLTTNTPADDVHKTLRYFDLNGYFDVVVTGDDVEKGKPDPEMIIKACELLGLDRSDVMLVGDTMGDIIAGKSAGCTVVGLNVEGDFRIKKLSELVDLIEQSFDNRD